MSGAEGPAEGLRFWEYWYGCGLDETGNQRLNKSQRRLTHLKKVIQHLSRGGPFISGYLGHLLCYDRLKNDFPNAIFIRLYRDPIDNILSIIEASKDHGGGWFSVRPRECREMEYGQVASIVSQVYWLNRKLDAAD